MVTGGNTRRRKPVPRSCVARAFTGRNWTALAFRAFAVFLSNCAKLLHLPFVGWFMICNETRVAWTNRPSHIPQISEPGSQVLPNCLRNVKTPASRTFSAAGVLRFNEAVQIKGFDEEAGQRRPVSLLVVFHAADVGAKCLELPNQVVITAIDMMQTHHLGVAVGHQTGDDQRGSSP